MAKEITSLLLNFNGANNSTTFIDKLGQTVTPYGDVKISTAQSKFGGSSAYFDGVGDYLEVTKSNNDRAWDFSTTDWTLECWVYPLDTNERSIFVSRSGLYSTFILFTTGGKFAGYASSGSGWNISITGSTTFSINQWYHLAFVRYGSLFILFVNGQVDGTGVYSGSLMNLIQPLIIGKDPTSNYANWYGYIDSFKLTNGRALYTEPFTPPTEEPKYDPYYEYDVLLLPFNGPNNSTVFGDYSLKRNIVTAVGNAKISTTQSKFGGSSAYFDGSSSYIQTSAPINFGTQDFTIEMWVYIQNIAESFELCSCGVAGVSGLFLYYIPSSFSLGLGCATTTVLVYNGNIINDWHNVCITRNNNIFYMFVDGNLVGSTALIIDAGNFVLNIATNRALNKFSTGYINDFRVTNSIARYTSNFTPPDKALYVPYNYDPFLDKVSLLCHMNGDNNRNYFC